MRRLVTWAMLGAFVVPSAAWAKGDKDKDKDEDDTAAADDDSDADAKPKKAKAKPKANDSDDASASDSSADDEGDEDAAAKPKKKPHRKDEDESDDDDVQKQDLSGHDQGTNKTVTSFEKDRFYVDKVDTEATENGTLVQGSLASSSFLYTEQGGNYTGNGTGSDASSLSRLFTELRLQTDFRHIHASGWEARIDARARMVSTPDNAMNTQVNHIQSGLDGQNEYDLRELWVVRSGARSDVFVGRQFIADLGAIKIDGVRVDYAKTSELTLIGFGGLYPLRGSRSITTDYIELKQDTVGADGKRKDAGQFVGAGGFGGAYRTTAAYGSLGVVALAPLAGTTPRVYATSSGYYRDGATLDLYHFALIDLAGDTGLQLTNLSGGVNYKPSPRLRLTASFNRVDTETLGVQANAFLNAPDTTGMGNQVIQNEAYVIRLATNQARAGVSAGLGQGQRFEVSTALAYRFRPAFTLKSPDPSAPVVANLPEATSAELWAGVTDRRSIGGLRLSLDVSRTFGVGTVAFQRNESLGVRALADHEFSNGKGEWEAEVAYASVQDNVTGNACGAVLDCFGSSSGTIISAGGQVYYRVSADWFVLGNLYISRLANTTVMSTGAMPVTDPSVTSATGFFRAAYRF